MFESFLLLELSLLCRFTIHESKKGDNIHLDAAANILPVRPVQRQHVGGGWPEEVGSVPCVDWRMKRRGAEHSEYEKIQSTAQKETADMREHSAIYMLGKAAAEWSTKAVRTLKSE